MTFDYSPLFRSTVGFDRLFRIVDDQHRLDDPVPNYPPTNIERVGETPTRITLAVAGFGEDELSVEARENTLTISGKKETDAGGNYLYRGIAGRTLDRQFRLAEHVSVTAANLANGLLTIDLVRELPEAKKPRRIAIAASGPSRLAAKAKKVIEGTAKQAA